MREEKKSVEDIYEAGKKEVQKIVSSIDSTHEQVEEASRTLDDLTHAFIKYNLETVEGRTAALTKLIAKLSQITEKVKVKPPYLDAINKFTSLAGTAEKLLKKEREKDPE
jgi:hypothetical protein